MVTTDGDDDEREASPREQRQERAARSRRVTETRRRRQQEADEERARRPRPSEPSAAPGRSIAATASSQWRSRGSSDRQDVLEQHDREQRGRDQQLDLRWPYPVVTCQEDGDADRREEDQRQDAHDAIDVSANGVGPVSSVEAWRGRGSTVQPAAVSASDRTGSDATTVHPYTPTTDEAQDGHDEDGEHDGH